MPENIHLTESEWSIVTNGLRCAAERYKEYSLSIVNSGIADRFAAQGRDAEALAEKIEAAIGL